MRSQAACKNQKSNDQNNHALLEHHYTNYNTPPLQEDSAKWMDIIQIIKYDMVADCLECFACNADSMDSVFPWGGHYVRTLSKSFTPSLRPLNIIYIELEKYRTFFLSLETKLQSALWIKVKVKIQRPPNSAPLMFYLVVACKLLNLGSASISDTIADQNFFKVKILPLCLSCLLIWCT